jgi:hypothetical protein
MNRREFVRLAGGGMTVGALPEAAAEARTAARPAATRAAGRARMKVGTQHGDSDEILKVLAGFGGGFLNFRETFIDDGDVDMLRAMRVYKEGEYHGMMMPDHVPSIQKDTGGPQAFAFTSGYIKALIAAVSVES